jgi:hypothetical protein
MTSRRAITTTCQLFVLSSSTLLVKCSFPTCIVSVIAVYIRDVISMTHRCRTHERPRSSGQTSLVAATSQSVRFARSLATRYHAVQPLTTTYDASGKAGIGRAVSVLYKSLGGTRLTMWVRCSDIRVCSRRECGRNTMVTGRCRKQMETSPEPPLLRQAVKTSLHVKGLSLLDRRFVPHHGSVSQMW